MHVLFSFTQDGLDVKEVYILSNLGELTVKGGVDVPGTSSAKATVKFVLPEKADFVNFQPQEDGRFVKFAGGFADTTGIAPGQMVSQIMAGYLLPFATPITYQLKTTLPVQKVSFVLAQSSGVTLKGPGMGAPEVVTSQDGQSFNLYKLDNLPVGQTLDITFEGTPNLPASQVAESTSTTNLPFQLPIFLGLGLAGVVLIGGGVFWWVRSSKTAKMEDEKESSETVQEEFEAQLAEIAQLDQNFEQGKVDETMYRNQRGLLMARAKEMQNHLAETKGKLVSPSH
jgi:hypothetical protein